jgi:Arc/MetJ-type ribon-helix-helix transcriptional regulator
MGLVGGKPTRAQLVPLLLGHKFWDPDWSRLKAAIEGDMSLTDLRGLRSETKQWHPPASKMNRDDLINYMYDTATALGWTWTMANHSQKMRVGRACKDARRPGRTKKAPRSVISKRSKPASTREPSRYNQYVSQFMRNAARRNEYPAATDRMRAAAQAWQETRAGRERNERLRQDRAERSREAGERSARAVAQIERGRKRRRGETTPRGKRRSTAGMRPRKRARADVDSDSDDDLSIPDLREKWAGKRRQVQGIRKRLIEQGYSDERGKKRKAS